MGRRKFKFECGELQLEIPKSDTFTFSLAEEGACPSFNSNTMAKVISSANGDVPIIVSNRNDMQLRGDLPFRSMTPS